MSTSILFNEYKYCKIIQTNLKLWVHMSTNNEKYLVLRGKNRDIYFIQKRLSKSQANALGKDFIKKSLETTDLNEAIIKRDKILAELDQLALNTKNKDNSIDAFDYESDIINRKISISGQNEHKEDDMTDLNINMGTNERNITNSHTETKKHTLFSFKVPKFPEKDDLVAKIDKYIPISIVIISIFIALIA